VILKKKNKHICYTIWR